MLAGGGVGPFAGRTGAALGSEQAHVHGLSGLVADVPDDPMAPDPPTVGEIVTAHRLGLAREAVCQIGDG